MNKNTYKILELKIKVIINNNLYKKNIIDEKTYSIVNGQLLTQILALQNEDNYELR
jgi:hypothetical protein